MGRKGQGVQERHALAEGCHVRFAHPWRVAAGFSVAHAVRAAQAQHAKRGAALRQTGISLGGARVGHEDGPEQDALTGRFITMGTSGVVQPLGFRETTFGFQGESLIKKRLHAYFNLSEQSTVDKRHS